MYCTYNIIQFILQTNIRTYVHTYVHIVTVCAASPLKGWGVQYVQKRCSTFVDEGIYGSHLKQ